MSNIKLFFLVFIMSSNFILSQDMENKLANEKSLYLKQHATNPVNWYPWGNQALDSAKNSDKLLLISVGYSSCHWCHVMEEESFTDNDVAQVMNSNFVNIKVDREERPDLDEIYMKALVLMTGNTLAGNLKSNMALILKTMSRIIIQRRRNEMKPAVGNGNYKSSGLI